LTSGIVACDGELLVLAIAEEFYWAGRRRRSVPSHGSQPGIAHREPIATGLALGAANGLAPLSVRFLDDRDTLGLPWILLPTFPDGWVDRTEQGSCAALRNLAGQFLLATSKDINTLSIPPAKIACRA
jgi:hypothetical protein